MTNSLERWAVCVIGIAVSGCGGYAPRSYAETSAAPFGEAYYASGESYSAPPENRIEDTAQDNRATLSLDVDTASYTLMRRDLRNGSLPNRDGVRVEEYVNFFDYDDAPPSSNDDAPFAVHLESAPSPFGGEGSRLLRVAVRAREIEQRPSANIVFLVDVSGSMADPNKLPLVRYSLSTLVDALRPDDTIAIVTYAGSDAIVLEPTPVEQRATILEAINVLGAGGSTNGAAGIRTAYDLASQYLREGGINRVILCTDGDFNVGVTGDALISLIEQERERGIALTTLGFGMGNYNDHDMERLADHGNGNYAYIDDRSEALRVLVRDLPGTLQVVAKDVKIQVELDSTVVSRFRLLGYENRVLAHEDFANDRVDAAEIGSGDFVTAFFEYELREGVDPAQSAASLATVRVRYKAPEGEQSIERGYEIAVRDVRPRFEDASTSLRFGAAVAELAEILRFSQHSEGARFADVRNIAQQALGQSPDQREFLELVGRAERLYRAQ